MQQHSVQCYTPGGSRNLRGVLSCFSLFLALERCGVGGGGDGGMFCWDSRGATPGWRGWGGVVVDELICPRATPVCSRLSFISVGSQDSLCTPLNTCHWSNYACANLQLSSGFHTRMGQVCFLQVGSPKMAR